MTKQYYSIRIGKNKNFFGFTLDIAKRLFQDLYNDFDSKGYFQECFGYDCTDRDFVAGSLGKNIDAQIYRLLRKENLWPISEFVLFSYTEDDLFDVIEFLYDHVSKPVKGEYHSWNQCGWHYSEFDKIAGQADFAAKLNGILAEYGSGFELSPEGLILVKDETELAEIFDAQIPTDNENIKSKINIASQKYRQSRSNLDERRIAIRELADILEFLRGEIKTYLFSKDEDALFNIANNFAIRHDNDKQKRSYDQDIWYRWMFYFYSATIHAVLRMKERKNKRT